MATGFSGGSRLEEALRKMADNLNKGKEVRVGFLEGATYPDGTSVPMVAAIQNYGAPAAGIPPRPFFSGMVKEKSPDWADSMAGALKANDYDAKVALGQMGEGIKGQLQGSITDLTEPELADSTKAAKGFDAPLIDTGHMQSSVDFEVKE